MATLQKNLEIDLLLTEVGGCNLYEEGKFIFK